MAQLGSRIVPSLMVREVEVSAAAVERRVAGRAEIAWDPEEMPYRMREFAIRDPDGHLLEFSEPIDDKGTG